MSEIQEADTMQEELQENGDQEQVMSNITVKFTGHGPVRKALTDLYFDQNTVYDAFSAFITQKSPELQQLRLCRSGARFRRSRRRLRYKLRPVRG